MLIGQLTDIHIGFDRTSDREANLVRLDAAVARLLSAGRRPDLVLLTGDLSEHGDAESYARLARALAPMAIPCWPIPGNHDARAALVAVFPQVSLRDGFLHYAIEFEHFRVVMVDTLEPGRHGGAFCEARAHWLSATLASRPDTPTLVAMHHPPFPSGIAWIDTDPGEAWIARFAAAVAGHAQIVGVTCGHVHRAMVTQWQGLAGMICPSTAPAVGLDLSPLDPDRPDDRVLVCDEGVGLALHEWTGTQLLSHMLMAGEAPALARFTTALQPMVQAMMAERP
jgi:3',5'-cyclic AMP phosphodiesterase CpdA